MLRTTLPLIWMLAQSLARTDKCTHIEYRGRNATQHNAKCLQTATCRKNFSISIINLPPYSTSRIFETIVQHCCGPCTNIDLLESYTNITEVRVLYAFVHSCFDFDIPTFPLLVQFSRFFLMG